MILAVLIVVSVLLAGALLYKPSLGGKPFAFAALFVLPILAGLSGVDRFVENSKKTTFCVSCHPMERYGRSLHVDDATLLAASHYQGGRIPRDEACFTCHTTYTMYGGFYAKLRGLKHVWVNYVGKVPAKLKLYDPYNNRECLHCHEGTRRYEAGETHHAEADRMQKMSRNELSCVSANCHDAVHVADEVDGIPLWAPGQRPKEGEKTEPKAEKKP